MSHFYTNVTKRRNRILVRGYKDGKRYKAVETFKPSLYVPTQDESKYRTIHGFPVKRVEFSSPNAMHEFRKKYEDISNFEIYGLELAQYQYLYENFPKATYDRSLIKECTIDIEVDTEDGYPDMETADKAITAITMLYKDIAFVFGYGEFETDDPSVKYVRCKNEHELLRKFLLVWESAAYGPDVVTGWNIEFFDIPYIVTRIARLFDDDMAKRLSPWGILELKKVEMFGKEHHVYFPIGISVLDYISLYKKFTFEPQESYRLDAIAEFELGEKKLDYSEYGSLNRLYQEDHQKFIEYNILDCKLVNRIDQRRNLLDLVYTIAYDAGVNYNDALTTVRSWDIAIHNYLMDRCTVVPKNVIGNRGDSIIGGFVKVPIVGMHEWVASFDLASLYPHLIMQYNIGPDTLTGTMPDSFTSEELIEGKQAKYADHLVENNLTMAASSCTFKKDKRSFLSALMKEMFEKRKTVKQEMIVLKQRKQDGENDLDNEISKLDTLQMALKIRLNSLYGSLANPYSRWYDTRLGESITKSGQLAVKTAAHNVNGFLNSQCETDNLDYIIAVDTDSIYVNLDPIVKKFKPVLVADYIDQFCENKIQPILNNGYNKLAESMNAYENAMFMKREVIADRAVWVAKKRYMLNVINNEGVQYAEPDIKIMGLESVRSSTPSACRVAIKEAFRIVLQEGELALQTYISDFRDKFMKLPFVEIAKNSGANGLEKYSCSTNIYTKGTPFHVRGSLLYNKMLKDMKLDKKHEIIFEGAKVKFVYLKMPNPLQENVIAVPSILPSDLGLDSYIDRTLQYEKTFLEPMKSMLDTIGWTPERVNTFAGMWE